MSDPVQRAYLDALARRTQAHSGALRERLEQRLKAARAACAEDPESARCAAAPFGTVVAAPRPLAELVAHIERMNGGPQTELRTLRRFRNTWLRLGLEQQLKSALAGVPENPGPLNSQRLVQRALRLLQQLSPAYLARFMAHAQALAWIDQAGASPAPARKPAADAPRRRKKA